MNGKGELAELRDRVAALEGEVAGLKRLLELAVGKAEPGADDSPGEPEFAERDHLRFPVNRDETPEESARRIRRALDRAGGQFTFDDAG
jgi:hypothetical protein